MRSALPAAVAAASLRWTHRRAQQCPQPRRPRNSRRKQAQRAVCPPFRPEVRLRPHTGTRRTSARRSSDFLCASRSALAGQTFTLRCGTTWADATGKCGTLCPKGTNEECAAGGGGSCFASLDPSPCATKAPTSLPSMAGVNGPRRPFALSLY